MNLHQYALYRCKADNNQRVNSTQKTSQYSKTDGTTIPLTYKYVFVNAQAAVERVHTSVIQELRDCLIELCHGAFTFDYSYHLSRNVQARMKKLRFQKKNIEQNIQDFVKCFSEEQIEATIIDEAVQQLIYGIRFSYQHRFNTADSNKDDDYRVMFFFNDARTPQHVYEQTRRLIAERTSELLQAKIVEEHRQTIQKERAFELVYAHNLNASLSNCLMQTHTRLSKIIEQAITQNGDPQTLDIYTRILRKAVIISQGAADTFMPQFIRQHTPSDSKGIVVVDWSESALIRLLETQRALFLHNGEDIISLRKFVQLLNDIFNIKESETFQLAVLFNTLYRTTPVPAVVSACGNRSAQHCYMFAKYFKSRSVCHVDKAGNVVIDPHKVIEFLSCYRKIEEYMKHHLQQFALFNNMGSILMFKKRNFGRLALVPNHYFNSRPTRAYHPDTQSSVRAIAEKFFWIGNCKHITQTKQTFNENDIQSYLNHLLGAESSDCVWNARPPTIEELSQVTPSPSSAIPKSNHSALVYNASSEQIQQCAQNVANQVYSGTLQVPQTTGLYSILQLNFMHFLRNS